MKLKHARKVRRLHLRELADLVGCSESLISKIENDRVSPSLRMLHRVTGALGTTIGALLTEGQQNDGPVMRKGERPIMGVAAVGRSQGSGVRLEVVVPHGELLYGSIHIIDPGGDSGGTISHRGEEVGYVLDGQVELTIDGKSYELKPGDSFFFKSDLAHGYRNMGAGKARILWINTPPTF